MERSAGFLTADKRGRRHAEKRWKEMGGRTKPGAGSATAIGKMECGQEDMWSRRSQVAVSAGFWSDCKSSVTEITGKRMRMSIATAAAWVRRLAPLGLAIRSQRHTISAASRAQTRFRRDSMLLSDSIPVRDASWSRTGWVRDAGQRYGGFAIPFCSTILRRVGGSFIGSQLQASRGRG
jgi:hypothetical protein